ncbi:MAG: integration host factor subunit alpha [Polyangiaceae bacterium]|nr:integration host factor subunit alpha [Polyangiaceae bacterium]
MIKADIAKTVAKNVGGVSRREAIGIVDLVFETMKETLGRGETVKISRFGIFTLRDKHARNGYNLHTGEALVIKGRRVVGFKPSPNLIEAMNNPSEVAGPFLDEPLEEDLAVQCDVSEPEPSQPIPLI